MTTPPVPETYAPASDYDVWFWRRVRQAGRQRVLEIGTRETPPGCPADFRAKFPDVTAEDYVRLNVDAGPDVDAGGNIHALPADWSGRFDVFLAVGVWEHLERPWIAAREVERVLAPGGVFLVVTHQTFPIHGRPGDFFRFSREALRLIFEEAGLVIEACDYKNRCAIAPGPAILPPDDVAAWNQTFPSYIHVGVAGHKPGIGRPAPRPEPPSKPKIVSWLRRASDRVAAEALGPAMTDIYEYSAPHPQNAIDLLPGWNHAFPPEMRLAAGPGFMYEDPRIHWAASQFGSLEGKRVCELGPLEGSHTWLLERLGARRIDAFEANKTACLRCLVAKEIHGMRRARFHLGDFVRGLAEPQYYDMIFACGVLYHMTDPLLLLERMAARTRAIYLWTHYFDEKEMPPGDPRRGAFRSPEDGREIVATGELAGVEMTMHLRSYHQTWKNSKFCGGPVDRHYWLQKDQLVAALRALGFNQMAFADEQPDHPNGPAFSLFARKG